MNTVFYRGGLANDYVICAQPLWVLLLIHGISTTHRRSLGLLMVWWFVKIYRSLFQNANECRRKNWVIKPQGTACPCGISLDIGVWRIWSGLKRLRRVWSILLFVIIDYTLRAQRFVQLLLLFISKYPPEGLFELRFFCFSELPSKHFHSSMKIVFSSAISEEKFWDILDKFWKILRNFEKFWEILKFFRKFIQ